LLTLHLGWLEWEFRFRSAEIGHVHEGGIVDIPFPRSVRDALLDERLAEEHYWVPNSGWVTYRVRSALAVQRLVGGAVARRTCATILKLLRFTATI
jgi:hypothetical protein